MDHTDAYKLGPPTPTIQRTQKEEVVDHFSLDPPITREGVMHALEVCVADTGVTKIVVEGGAVTVTRMVNTSAPLIPGPEAVGLTEESVEYALSNIELAELPPTSEPLHDLIRAGKVLKERGLQPRYLLLASDDTFAYAILTLNTGHVLGIDVFLTNSLSIGVGILIGTPTFRCDIISAEYGMRISVDEPIREIGEN